MATHLRESLFAAALLCFGCGSDAEPVEAPTESVEVPAVPTLPQPSANTTPAPREPRVRPATPAARAAAARGLDQAAREKARLRSERLREGRRLGRTSDHEGSLAAFEQALEIAPGDPTLLCEAGFQAFQLGRLERAAELLTPALARVMQAPTRGACLYNLGRVREAQGETSAARRLYSESVEARPNRIVARRLAGLAPEAAVETADVPESSSLLRTLQAGGPAPTLAALASRSDCLVGGRLGDSPEASPTLRELHTIECDDQEYRISFGVLVVRGDAGFSAVWPITMSDTGDMYGRVEAFEHVREPLVWTDERLTIHVDGADDEVDGEGAAYFFCEGQHEEDQEALDACFAREMEGQGEPYTWTRELVFRVSNGVLTYESSDGPEHGLAGNVF